MKTFFIFLLLMYQMVDGSQRPMDTVADLTNDLGVCILQILATMQDGNIVFSPYGIASVSVLLFEGAAGNTAYEILRVLNLPWDTLLARIGFRDLNRHLKTYFKSDGFLRGLIMSRDEVCFHSHYQKILRLYGFEEPDNSLTYPCHGFIPYSPSTTALPAVTTEAVTIASTSDASTPADETTSPSVPEEGTPASTELTTVTDENIVTELTQTSQTVMLFNTTTFRTINASDDLQESSPKSPSLKETTTDVINTDSTMLKTEITSLPQESFTATSEAMLTSYNINPFVNVASLSSTQSSVTVPITNQKLNEPFQTTEITETSPKSESVTLSLRVNTIEPSGSETVLVPNFSSPSNLPFDISASESSPEALKSILNRVNATRSLFKEHGRPVISKTNRELLKNEMKKILDKYKHRNFTNINDIIDEIEKDFRSNSTQKNFTFPDDFIDDLLASTKFAPNSSESGESLSTTISNKFKELNEFLKNNSINSISSTEIFKDFINRTRFQLFNDSSKNIKDFHFNDTLDFSTEKFDNDISLELIPLNETNILFNSSSEVNFNEISNLYDNFLGIIENTTKSIRNFIGFSTTTTSPITTTVEPNIMLTTLNPLNSTEKTIKSDAKNSTNSSSTTKNEIAEIPTLSLKNNLNKSELGNEALGGHILPKKSISGQNEDLISEFSSRSPPNYVNVLSLKQSKLTSTKFDIKGIHPSKNNFKRNKREKLMEINERRKHNHREAKAAGHIDCNSELNKNKNSLCVNLNATERISSNQTTLGKRKPRSFDHDLPKNVHKADFLNSDFDWFALYDGRNVIRAPTFYYSAFLPFAYIDDLKSKVLEIPLDDSQYSLIILLPTHRYGLNYLLSSIRNWPIRKIHRQLRSHSVYAIIPKFSVISHVDLKPALYALGMKDVFHRYRADLSVMSPDARLFVRSIEQVVTVNVDKYPSAVYEVPEKLTERYFAALHPFLYFVIDKESEVSLVAGIMADPSKQHIHFL